MGIATKETQLNTKSVEEYYDVTQRWYTWVYSDKESLALHYGFWDDSTVSKKEALINQYRAILRLLDPRQEELILDAGCGVGGASLWLSCETRAHFVGITLSAVQLQLARKYAEERKLEGRVEFYRKNYFATDFPDETFHKVFAIESFCHSYPFPEKVLKEMWRALKPGGKIVISDGILLRQPLDEHEGQLCYEMQSGFKMNGWSTPEEIVSALEKVGFHNIRFLNKTDAIRKSVEDIYRLARLMSPLSFLRYLGLITKIEVDQLRALDAQKKMYDIGLFGHGTFYAEKPVT